MTMARSTRKHGGRTRLTLRQRIDNLEAAFVVHQKRLDGHEKAMRDHARSIRAHALSIQEHAKSLARTEKVPCIGFTAEGTPGYDGSDD